MSPVAKKITVGLGLGAITIAMFVAGSLPLAVFAGVVTLVASGEFFAMIRARGTRPVPLVGFAALAFLFVIAYQRGERAPLVFPAVVAGAFAVTAGVMMLRRRTDGGAAAIAATLLGVVYVGMFGAYIVVMLRMPHGRGLLLGFALMTVLNDVGSYIVGGWRGRHPLAPSVSPSKTWEGFAGGSVVTLVTAVVVSKAISPPYTLGRALILAAIVLVAAPVGDLCESMLKRDADVKDTGTIFPGHGGVLDRLDSLLIAAPLYFYAWRVLIR
ncbi:MAG: phosphatidate cytidylyltransferase [Actinomycetota bacterium]|nr:phosphatidate cytidylyltransferase [Actinomycetota bacterium]